MKTEKHIISLSSGVPSALAAILAVEKYGREHVELIFADTQAEHPDNYRFLRDIENYLGMKATWLTEGRTPLEVGQDEKYIPNQAFATCTHRLKIEPIMAYVDKLKAQYDCLYMHIGYDLTDLARVEKTRASWQERGLIAVFPLIEARIRDPKNEVEKRGLRIPYTYSLGFKHGNCLGENMGGCVKFGRGDMIKVLQHFPHAYKLKENRELEMIGKQLDKLPYYLITALIWGVSLEDLGYKLYTFLRDTSGEYGGFLTLKKLREDYESRIGNIRQLRLFDMQNDMSGYSTECGVSQIGVSA